MVKVLGRLVKETAVTKVDINGTPKSVLNNALAIMPAHRNKPTCKTALYLRLSRDDSNGSSESMSIQSQRDMLTAYAEDNGYDVVGVYADDGYSGTNYERPEFKRMIEDIKLGRVNLVITKDAAVKQKVSGK